MNERKTCRIVYFPQQYHEVINLEQLLGDVNMVISYNLDFQWYKFHSATVNESYLSQEVKEAIMKDAYTKYGIPRACQKFHLPAVSIHKVMYVEDDTETIINMLLMHLHQLGAGTMMGLSQLNKDHQHKLFRNYCLAYYPDAIWAIACILYEMGHETSLEIAENYINGLIISNNIK